LVQSHHAKYQNFNRWNEIKKETEIQIINKYCKERDIWWSKVGCNLGHEQDGKGKSYVRPILIIKKFNNRIFWALPLSSVIKNNKYYYSFLASDNIERSAIISQIRLLDIVRLEEKIGNIDYNNFRIIKKSIKNLLD
jgi:mRNA interferase MazF